MAGIIDYGQMARGLLGLVTPVASPYTPLQKGLLGDVGARASEGARVYQGGANSRSYFSQAESAPVNEGINSAEDAWRGGVANFGDPTSALHVQNMKGYFDYKSHLEDAARNTLGDSFTLYRYMPKEQFNAWKNGDDMNPVGASLSESFAKNFKKFAAHPSGPDRVLVKINANPNSVVMRGADQEQEIVIDPNQISGSDISIMK